MSLDSKAVWEICSCEARCRGRCCWDCTCSFGKAGAGVEVLDCRVLFGLA